jgi:hypothetical protein
VNPTEIVPVIEKGDLVSSDELLLMEFANVVS